MTETNEQLIPVNILDIMSRLPHRYPMLLIDRVVSLDKARKKIVALKNVTINEPHFMGHFPKYPVMPGVLIVEAMAQASGMLAILLADNRPDNELYLFASISNAKFKRQVIPGDTLMIEVELLKMTRGVGKYRARALVDGVLASEAELLIAKKEM